MGPQEYLGLKGKQRNGSELGQRTLNPKPEHYSVGRPPHPSVVTGKDNGDHIQVLSDLEAKSPFLKFRVSGLGFRA